MLIHYEAHIDNGDKPIIKVFDTLDEVWNWLKEKKYIPADGYTTVEIHKVEQIYQTKRIY